MRASGTSAFLAAAMAAALLAGCGGGGGSGSAANRVGEGGTVITEKSTDGGGSAHLLTGCAPPQVADRLIGLFRSVGSRDRRSAFRYIAAGPGLAGFAIYDGRGPGAAKFESANRAAIYRRLTELIHADDHPRLLAAEVGDAPQAGERHGPSAGQPAAGVGFAVALGRRSANGKAGIDCGDGRFYVAAMNFGPGLIKQQACGEYVHLRSHRPLVCAVGSKRPRGGPVAHLPGLRLTEPPGWHRVPMKGIAGADHMLTFASFAPDGAVKSLCSPRAVLGLVPAGGALVQFIVRRPGPPGLSRTGPADQFPRPKRPFALGRARPFECGESFNLSFREGSEVVQLRVWTKPGGMSDVVRHQIERMVDSLRLDAERPSPSSTDRLGVTYGPYLGVRCREPNSIRCDEVGIDVVLKERASHVSASIAGRAISLRTPGFHNGIRGRDWVRPRLAHAGLMRRGSPLYVGDGKRRWVGDPPVYVPIRITATLANGERRTLLLRHVRLSAGWG